MTDADLEAMRLDWRVVAGFRRGSGEWSVEDEGEFGEAIRQAVESGSAEVMRYWAWWLAHEAEGIRRFVSMVRAAEGRMRARARQEREARERQVV